MSEKVHLGVDRWHSDRHGIPACPHIMFGGEPVEVTTKEDAEERGYEACGRCVECSPHNPRNSEKETEAA